MKSYVYKLLFLLSLIFIGCSSTDIETVRNPDIDLKSYTKIFLYADFQDIKFRRMLEEEFFERLSMQKIDSVKSIEIIPPLKEYSDSDIKTICNNTASDLIIKISLIYLSTNNTSGSSVMIPTGGFLLGVSSSEIKLSTAFDVEFFDLARNELVLRCTAKIDKEDDDLDDCLEETAESLAEDIVKEFFYTNENNFKRIFY